MVSVVILDGQEEEIRPLKNIIKNLAAKLTKDNWKMETFCSWEQSGAYLETNPLVDLFCYDIVLDDAILNLKKVRENYEESGLILIADSNISPLVYLKPGICPDSLLMRPLEKRMVNDTIEEFLLFYLEKLNRNSGVKSYIIDSKEGRINLPYHNVFFFEAREKKIFARTLNEEYGFYTTIEKLEKELPDTFVRCHRSFIINADKVVKIMLSQNMIELTQDFIVPLSRSYKPVLKNFRK